MTTYLLFLSNSVHKNSVQTVDKGRSKVPTERGIPRTCNDTPVKARLPVLPVTGHPMTTSRRCDVTIRGVSNFLNFEPPGDGRSN